MARTYRKTPVFGNCCGNDTPFRRAGNRRIRRVAKWTLRCAADYDEMTIPTAKELSEDEWHWPSDGRGYWATAPKEMMRK